MRVWYSLPAALLVAGLLLGTGAKAQTTERVSVTGGTEANGYSFDAAISADGRFVAFESFANNLSPGGNAEGQDIFVHDRVAGTTEHVSIASDGTPANSTSHRPSISADGRLVAFHSYASNLVPGDTNDTSDVFVHDRETGITERVSVAADGDEANGAQPVLSADGRFVVFASSASNLVANDTNARVDVFIRDLDTGMVERVSIASDGTQGNGTSNSPVVSADGRLVAFGSYASTLVEGDTNNAYEIFVHDRETGTTERVALASDGNQGNLDSWHPSISADGRFITFVSFADNLVPGDMNSDWDAFVHDRETGSTVRVSVASDGTEGFFASWSPSISADGRFVAFASWADNLVEADTNGGFDIFVHDRVTGTTERLSVASDGAESNSHSYRPAISANGRFVAFDSYATNLVPDDSTLGTDIFVRDRGAPPLLSITGACPGSVSLSLSGATLDGLVAFGWGTGAGAFTLPPGLCSGAEIGLADPNPLIVLTADQTGAISWNGTVGVNMCGQLLQALDVETCGPSNVASLP